MNSRDAKKKEFIERMVSEGGLDPRFLEHKCAYDKLATIVDKYVELVGDEYTVTITPFMLVENGHVSREESTEKVEGGTIQQKTHKTLSIDDENILHEILNIKEQINHGDGKYHLNEYNCEGTYNKEGMEIEEEEKFLNGVVVNKPAINEASFYNLADPQKQANEGPYTTSVNRIKRTNELVTACVERETTVYDYYQGATKKKDTGYIKLGDQRSSDGSLHGYTALISPEEEISKCTYPTISLPEDRGAHEIAVRQLREDYVLNHPTGVVSQAIMRQELEKNPGGSNIAKKTINEIDIGKEEIAKISRSGLEFADSVYNKLQNLQKTKYEPKEQGNQR